MVPQKNSKDWKINSLESQGPKHNSETHKYLKDCMVLGMVLQPAQPPEAGKQARSLNTVFIQAGRPYLTSILLFSASEGPLKLTNTC